MGILSKLKERKKKVDVKEVKEVKKDKVSKVKTRSVKSGDYDVVATLASYIIGVDIIVSELFEENDEFAKVYSKYRVEQGIEKIINDSVGYDKLFVAIYGSIREWLEKEGLLDGRD